VNILIVSATEAEVAPCAAALRAHPRHAVELLITGVGMVATAAWCARALAGRRYDLALNLGVCGSFDPAVPPGTVVHVVADRLSELGAEDGDRFLAIEELGLGQQTIVNQNPPALDALQQLPRVAGITVNTVHGSERSISGVRARLGSPGPLAGPVETMEGAAFLYACAMQTVPHAQVRAVSNLVERRNRAAWKMEDAIHNLGAAAIRILDTP
jgi:futalosine hydrolase